MFDYIKLLFLLYFRERVLNATLNEANIQHLKPDTNYQFRIRTYNSHGPSPNFARISITTERDSKLSIHYITVMDPVLTLLEYLSQRREIVSCHHIL